MRFEDFSLLKEDEDSYEIGHPEGRSIHVPKKGLTPKAETLIHKLRQEQSLFKGSPSGIGLEDDTEEDEVPGAVYVPPTQLVVPRSRAPEPEPLPEPETVEEPLPVEPPLSEEPHPATLDQTRAHLVAGQKIKQEARANEARSYHNAIQALETVETPEQKFERYQTKDKAFEEYLENNPINPNRYFENRDTATKTRTAIALFLGGFGQGLVGGTNPAEEFLKRTIQADIEAQKADRSEKMNLWKMNRQNSRDDIDATLKTTNQMWKIVEVNAKEQAAKAKSVDEQARAAEGIAKIDAAIAKRNELAALMDAPQFKGVSDADPAELVPYKVPIAQQKDAYKAIETAQAVKRTYPKLMEAFNLAVKENTFLRTGNSWFRTPGSVHRLHALMTPLFGPIDSTVAKAARDQILSDTTPGPRDTDSDIEQKRKALQDWATTFLNVPILKGNGIDLEKFKSTQFEPNQTESKRQDTNKFLPHDQALQWAREHPDTPQAKKIFKLNGVQ
jgi:hypothetical protein